MDAGYPLYTGLYCFRLSFDPKQRSVLGVVRYLVKFPMLFRYLRTTSSGLIKIKKKC